MHLVEPVHAGGGLLGDAADVGGDLGVLAGCCGQRAAQHVQDDRPLLGVVLGGLGHSAGQLELAALVDQHRGVAAVVEDQVGAAAVWPRHHLLGAPPVLLERLALPGVHRGAAWGVGGAIGADHDRGCGVVLGGEDVAAGPADLGAQRGQRLDEHRGLDGHVQRAGDAGALERLLVTVHAANGHEAGHLVLGELHLLAAEAGKAQVGDGIVAVALDARG